jgi:putative endonuclease
MREEKRYFVYIKASRRNGTLYIGFSGALLSRITEYKNDVRDGFTKKYGVHMLVWYEMFYDVHHAVAREKQLKGWNRAWKLKLIEKMNPDWRDLYDELLEGEGYAVPEPTQRRDT